MRTLLVSRAPQFSPNSVEKDRMILEAVGRRLQAAGILAEYADEESLTRIPEADLILTMGRLPHTIQLLRQAEEAGVRVVNSARALSVFSRLNVESTMRRYGIPAAQMVDIDSPVESKTGYWVKRGDMAAQSKGDVQYAQNAGQLRQVVSSFRERGIADIVVTTHEVGDLVKFYGVEGTDFFRITYPTDDGQTKFDDEKRNGQAHHYTFDVSVLQRDAERLSQLTGVSIYGGDAIVRADGTFAIIDFNDWPSFSQCREEAAAAIVGKLESYRIKELRQL